MLSQMVKPQTQPLSRASLRYWLGSLWDWTGVLFLFLILGASILSIEQGRWITPQPSLMLTLVLAILTAWLLVKSQLPTVVIYCLAVVLGMAITAWQASSILPPPETVITGSQFMARLQFWWQLISITRPSDSTIHFATFLVFLTWMAGYVSAWYFLQKRNAWIAVSLSGMVILVNLRNLTAEYYGFFFVYLVAALLLVGQANLARRYRRFKENTVRYSKRSIGYFMALLLCFSLLTVATVWQIPEIRAKQLETLVSTQMTWSKDVERHWLNLLAGVRKKKSSFVSSERRELYFNNSFHRGDEVLFVVTSEEPNYWQTQMYDSYASWGWKNSLITELKSAQLIADPENGASVKSHRLTYTVITKVSTDVLLTAGEFLSSDTSTLLEALPPLSFTVNLVSSSKDGFLSQDVASFTRSLQTAWADGGISGLDDIRQLLPRETLLTSLGKTKHPPTEANYQLLVENDQLGSVGVTRKQQGSDDIIAVIARHPLEPGENYAVTVNIADAIAHDLSEAGDDYPPMATDYFLQLPPALPERISELSKAVTREAKSPYDKALAIKGYLSRIPYSENVTAPPQGVDGVDYFLFTKRTGNCGYFASAMAVMLRSINIPARVCAGYLPVQRDIATGNFVIRSKQYHAWTEVYFPGYGWIVFEATPEVASGDSEAAFVTVPDYGWVEFATIPGYAWMDSDATADTGRETSGLAGEREWRQSVSETTRDSDEIGEKGVSADNSRETAVDKSAAPAEQQAASPAGLEPNLTLLIIIGIIFAVLLVVILVSAFYGWLWYFPRPDYGSGVYAKMCLLASRAKLNPRPQQTPLEYGAELSAAFPRQAEAIHNIIQTYNESRYGRRKDSGTQQGENLERSWRVVYEAFLKRLFRLR